MKAVILAGGLGTRISEETAVLPKPMVEIGGQPILWHMADSSKEFQQRCRAGRIRRCICSRR